MATSDLGHQLTDKELAKLERRIAKLYREAGKELQATIDAYFEQFKKRDEEMKALIGTVQNGKEWTEADYKQWRLNQIGRGERYQAMRDKVAHRVTDANAVAASYTNDATPSIYSLNRNYSAYTIESVAGNVGFDLWDEQTVKRLMVVMRFCRSSAMCLMLFPCKIELVTLAVICFLPYARSMPRFKARFGG